MTKFNLQKVSIALSAIAATSQSAQAVGLIRSSVSVSVTSEGDRLAIFFRD